MRGRQGRVSGLGAKRDALDGAFTLFPLLINGFWELRSGLRRGSDRARSRRSWCPSSLEPVVRRRPRRAPQEPHNEAVENET
jgi:hypothetical protein